MNPWSELELGRPPQDFTDVLVRRSDVARVVADRHLVEDLDRNINIRSAPDEILFPKQITATVLAVALFISSNPRERTAAICYLDRKRDTV